MVHSFRVYEIFLNCFIYLSQCLGEDVKATDDMNSDKVNEQEQFGPGIIQEIMQDS